MTGACVRCGREGTKARHLCTRCYSREFSAGRIENYPLQHGDAFVNPLVCVCRFPLADPRVRWGECKRCRRKPLALFGIR